MRPTNGTTLCWRIQFSASFHYSSEHAWCGSAESCGLLYLQARDPIPQFKEYMLKNGLASEADIKAIHDK